MEALFILFLIAVLGIPELFVLDALLGFVPLNLLHEEEVEEAERKRRHLIWEEYRREHNANAV